MRLKGFFAVLVMILIMALVCVAPALADPARATVAQAKDPRDTLSVTASVTPSGMAVPAEAHIFIILANSATAPISDIAIMDSEGNEIRNIGELSGSDGGRSSEVYEWKITPSAKQLEAEGIEYQVYYTIDKGLPTEIRRKTIELAPIVRLQAEPQLEFTRTPSANFSQPGEQITITYRIRNTGNVPLTGIALRDELIGEIGTVDVLGPGQKRAFPVNVVVDENNESKPSVSYGYDGHDGELTKSLDPIMIVRADEQLDVLLEADKTAVLPGGEVQLQLKITNKGNVVYDKLELSDEALGAFGPMVVDLKPGESFWFNKAVNIKSTTTFEFTVNGKMTSDSRPITAVSNMLTVAVTPPVNSVDLELSVTADQHTLPGPGPVNFTINISNRGDMDIRNVELSEQTRGEIKNLAVVALGDTPVQAQYQLAESAEFLFMATLRDANGDITVKRSPPIQIDIRPDSALALVSPQPESTSILGIADTAYRMEDDNEGIFRRMMFTVLAMLGILLAILVISTAARYNRRRKQKLQQMKRLRKGKRQADAESDAPSAEAVKQDTGVYKKSDLAPNKELS